jgi:lipopolysaccharide transport system ATP-binding protein
MMPNRREAAVISVDDLGKRFRIWTHSKPTSLSDRVHLALSRARARDSAPTHEEIWALRHVSFEVGSGEVLGVIGPNGAGKSTLLSVLARITDPTEGRATIHGRVSSLLEVGTGFHPELSGRDNVFLNGAVLGMSRAETARKFDEIVDFSGVGEFINMPVKRYSSGMYVRLAFSVAAHLDPEVLLLDEVLAVGDQSFQQKCLRRIEEITSSGKTVLFVSHDVHSVARLCKQALVIDHGTAVFQGDVTEAIERYMTSDGLGGKTVKRAGTGVVRIISTSVMARAASELHPGRPADVAIELEAARSIRGRDLELRVLIGSSVSGYLTTLSTSLDPALELPDLSAGDRLTVVCHTEGLPFRPGSYYVSASVTRPGELLDEVERAAEFTLFPSDFHEIGVMTPEQLVGHVLVRQSWERVDARPNEQRSAVGAEHAR